MRDIPRFAVILTHNRPGLLKRCVDAIVPQVDHVIVLDNASDPPAALDLDGEQGCLVFVPDQPPCGIGVSTSRGGTFEALTRPEGTNP